MASKKVVVKKRKKRISLIKVTTMFFFVSISLYFCSSLFLRSYNNNLSANSQKIQAEISALQIENDAIAVQVNTLNNRDRVTTIASDDGLTLDQTNIVTITQTEGD